jgi:large subunit ribosomal protein L25
MLNGIIRESIGKKATKAARRDGYLVANIYGKGLENIQAAFKSNEYIRTVKNKETVAFDVKVGDKELKVVAQAYQVHPLSGDLVHVDLLVAQAGIESKYMIPVVTTGEALGLKNKGLLNLGKKRIAVKCTIENLPLNVTIDITDLDLGDSFLIRDLAPIENVTFLDSDRVSILSIIKAK